MLIYMLTASSCFKCKMYQLHTNHAYDTCSSTSLSTYIVHAVLETVLKLLRNTNHTASSDEKIFQID